MKSRIQGIYFDFGYVIGYPQNDINRKYLYLDWHGLRKIRNDNALTHFLRQGVGLSELKKFFINEIYDVFIQHENTDLIDPKANRLLLDKLHLIFDCPINQLFVDRILTHINTMKYIEIDKSVSQILKYLKNKNLCISMISNMMLPGRLLREKLLENNVLDYFNTVTISSDLGFIKPHKQIFIDTLKKDHLTAQEVLFVGDNYKQDIIGANSVGMTTVWLNQDNSIVPEKKIADFEIHNLNELLELI